MGSSATWKRIHPASVWVNLLPLTWRTIRQFWPVLILAMVGGRPDYHDQYRWQPDSHHSDTRVLGYSQDRQRHQC